MLINKKNTVHIFFLSLFVILVFLLILYVVIGPVQININQSTEIILSYFKLISEENISFNQIQKMVLLDIRIPRLILAILVGAGLGMSGAILQGLFRNPLIDPGFIGVSSGAAVGALFAIMFSQFFYFYFDTNISNFLLPILAMSGSFITTFIIYRISKSAYKTNIMTMLLAGIAVNALSGSIIGLFINFTSDLELRSFTFWTLGGLDTADWQVVSIVALFILSSIIFIYSIRNKLDIFMLGDAQAHHLGVNVESLKKKIILFSAIIVGISVAFCGMIGFIGLVTPHLIRLFIGPKHKYLIPGSALLGSIILVISDLISKTIISPAQLPIGVITSLIGAPFFIFLILKQKNKIGYAE
tara:strand:- start:5688 stop:6758 length:1071 start_codon:yes stop_codon:yes gene_type:complete